LTLQRYSTGSEVSEQTVIDEDVDLTNDQLSRDERLKRFDLTNYSEISIVEGAYDSAEFSELAIAPYLTKFNSTGIEIQLQFR